GPVDGPHPARLYLSTFWVQNHWGRWAHARKSIADLRWHGKIRCKPDATWETTVAIGLNEVLCRKLDYRLPKIFFKTPVLGFFLIWLLAYLDSGPTWEDRDPEPQHKQIKTFVGGLAPFAPVPRPDADEERRLFERFKNSGDVIARNTLIAGHLWIADKLANRFRPARDSDWDDLRQDAAEALFAAVDQFDHRSKNRFATFAWAVVKNDIKDRLRHGRIQQRDASTELIAEKNEAALGLYASNPKRPSPEYKIFHELFGKT